MLQLCISQFVSFFFFFVPTLLLGNSRFNNRVTTMKRAAWTKVSSVFFLMAFFRQTFFSKLSKQYSQIIHTCWIYKLELQGFALQLFKKIPACLLVIKQVEHVTDRNAKQKTLLWRLPWPLLNSNRCLAMRIHDMGMPLNFLTFLQNQGKKWHHHILTMLQTWTLIN